MKLQIPHFQTQGPMESKLELQPGSPSASYLPGHLPTTSPTFELKDHMQPNENPSWLETTKVSLLPSSSFPISHASQPGLQNHNEAQTRTQTRGHRASNFTCQHENLLSTPTHHLMTVTYGVKSLKARVSQDIKTYNLIKQDNSKDLITHTAKTRTNNYIKNNHTNLTPEINVSSQKHKQHE